MRTNKSLCAVGLILAGTMGASAASVRTPLSHGYRRAVEWTQAEHLKRRSVARDPVIAKLRGQYRRLLAQGFLSGNRRAVAMRELMEKRMAELRKRN